MYIMFMLLKHYIELLGYVTNAQLMSVVRVFR
jgi:hypothetical protein